MPSKAYGKGAKRNKSVQWQNLVLQYQKRVSQSKMQASQCLKISYKQEK